MTESETESDSSLNLDGIEQEQSADDSNNNGQGEAAKPATASKRVNEVRYVTANMCSRLTYLQKPTWDLKVSNTSKARSHVIVRNRYIEISDDDTDLEISPTPASRRGSAKGPAPLPSSDSPKGIVFNNCELLR